MFSNSELVATMIASDNKLSVINQIEGEPKAERNLIFWVKKYFDAILDEMVLKTCDFGVIFVGVTEHFVKFEILFSAISFF